MGRKANGLEAIERAREAIATAKTVNELRTAQAVLLPLEFGLTIAQTAKAVGKSGRWASTARQRFIRADSTAPSKNWGGRRNALLSEAEEIRMVKRAVVLSNWPGAPSVRQLITRWLQKRGACPSPSTITAIMHRATGRLFPGQDAHYLERNIGLLSQKWHREVGSFDRRRGFDNYDF